MIKGRVKEKVVAICAECGAETRGIYSRRFCDACVKKHRDNHKMLRARERRLEASRDRVRIHGHRERGLLDEVNDRLMMIDAELGDA